MVQPDGRHQHTGPYDFVKAIEGGLFTHSDYLGAFALPPSSVNLPELWREVAFLPPT